MSLDCLCSMAFSVPQLTFIVTVTCLNLTALKYFQKCPLHFFSDYKVTLAGGGEGCWSSF